VLRELRRKIELIIFGYKAQEIPPKISPHPPLSIATPPPTIFYNFDIFPLSFTK